VKHWGVFWGDYTGPLVFLLSEDETYCIVIACDEFATSAVVPKTVSDLPVKEISEDAFSDCSKLTSIEIPDSVATIGAGAFGACDSVETITVSSGNETYHSDGNCLIETESKTLVSGCKNSIIPADGSVTTIGDYAFYDCDNLTSIEIPDSVTTIGEGAFYGCDNLTSIEIPNSVTTIGDYAFEFCLSLASIEIPNSVTTIGDYAFSDCSSLTSIEIPDSVATIGAGAFSACDSVETITVSSGNETYHSDGNCLIETESKTLVSGCKNSIIPADGSVTTIGDYAFSDCDSLTSIEIPNSVTTIGDYAFYACSSLTSIEIPDSVTTIGDYAFYGCSSLTSIEIPDSVTTIGDYAFELCLSLASIEIPDSVTTIGDYAFEFCLSLASIEIPNSVTTIGSSAFENCDRLTSVTIGNSVTTIGDHAFYDCDSLTSIEISNSVTTIGDYAFYACASLTSIEIPDSVTTIGEGAFYGCDNLTSIEIPDSVTTIGDYAFKFCSSLTSIEIPNSVTSIGEGAFYGCDNLTSIEIPNSVTYIGARAFEDCSSLTDIYCEAESQPEGWSTGYYDEYGWWLGGWSGYYATVHFGAVDGKCAGVGEWISDGDNHWKPCPHYSVVDLSPHTPGAEADCENDQICTVCEYVLVEAYGHKAESDKLYSDGTNHWKLCSCGEKVEITIHTPGAEADCENDQICTICEHVLVEAYGHSASSNKWYSDGNNHWKLCSCDEKVELDSHTPGAEADCENDQICTVCEHVLVEAYGHSAKDNKWHTDDNNHWHECTCGEHLDEDTHDFEWVVTSEPDVGVPGEEALKCTVCGHISDTKEIPALEPEILLGDVNGNGTLDTMDYSLLKRVYFGIYNTSNLDAGDINGNGGLDTMDYSLLKRVYFGIYSIN